ncbi:alpha-N-arabinofuranosidase [uncultured Sphaerochaeta sp.]|uniref:arabinosylfuranosidase ArfA n=1 Tax=uncultured Sphaerochaeta sp. TaxID=886478 RepID=UPI002AA84A56|nr:alpha-N-arabinofuranosidase [uncultured Sphaerochaeta sp.]
MKCTVHASKHCVIGTADKRLFSSFVEQLGRCVYGGIYEKDHPLADKAGMRTDVMKLVKDLDIPMIRFPGGNYVSNHRWEDSVGPVEERPVRLDLAWKALDPNTFGIKEFMDWCQKVGTEPMMALNLGTRGIDEAKDLVEYCNHPGGTALSELRKRHGSEAPYDIKMWCLGNEMDGPWQVGHKTAEEYGRLASEVGKALKLYDPSLELVACGSSNSDMPTFPAWEETVLEHTWDIADYLSLHMYFRNDENDAETFLASSKKMDEFIETVVHVCDYVQAKKRSSKTMFLSFDEWNVWFHSNEQDKAEPDWKVGKHLLEDVYTFEDALVVGCLLNSLLKHCDRVKVACLAQLVNVIAPIMTEDGGPSWAQTIYWPFYYASKYGRGEVLDIRLDVPSYNNNRYGEVPYADAVLVYHEEEQELDLFVVNRSLTEELTLNLDTVGFGQQLKLIEHIVLHHPDLKASNNKDNPNRIMPVLNKGTMDQYLAPKQSWNLLRFSLL